MQELEKILEEIERLRGQVGSECTSEDHYMKRAWEHCLDRVEDIVRKHMSGKDTNVPTNDGCNSVGIELEERGAITMTENEEIKKVINGLNFLKEKLYNGIYADRLDCIDYAISALKEVQQYREIGTVKECREAVEKQKTKKRIYPKTALERYYHAPECPNCKRELKPRICGYTLSQAIGIYSYCPWCGQNLEGGEESEGE